MAGSVHPELFGDKTGLEPRYAVDGQHSFSRVAVRGIAQGHQQRQAARVGPGGAGSAGGHALGLGHSADARATMYLAGSGLRWRSLERVREIASFGGNVSQFVHPVVETALQRAWARRKA